MALLSQALHQAAAPLASAQMPAPNSARAITRDLGEDTRRFKLESVCPLGCTPRLVGAPPFCRQTAQAMVQVGMTAFRHLTEAGKPKRMTMSGKGSRIEMHARCAV